MTPFSICNLRNTRSYLYIFLNKNHSIFAGPFAADPLSLQFGIQFFLATPKYQETQSMFSLKHQEGTITDKSDNSQSRQYKIQHGFFPLNSQKILLLLKNKTA